MEDIADVDYRHAKAAFKLFNNKNIGKYHDLYIQSDTVLLSDVFENFRDKCIEIYELDPAHFLSAPRLAWEACLKKDINKIKLLADIDMLLMGKKGIRWECVMQYIDMQNQIKNTWKTLIKPKNNHMFHIFLWKKLNKKSMLFT